MRRSGGCDYMIRELLFCCNERCMSSGRLINSGDCDLGFLCKKRAWGLERLTRVFRKMVDGEISCC